jgi:homoserine O-acetyltransferase/O-succinyltransferase
VGVRVAAGAVFLLAWAAAAPPIRADENVEQAFTLQHFRLENGVELPEAHINYATFGTRNRDGTNVIVLPSHYMADFNGYRSIIGKDKALDPGKYFLVATELFGNGHSSSPSNTPEPFHGPRFPLTSIRDNVEAIRRLMFEKLGVHHLRAAIGFSMGGEQVLQLAVSHPDFVDGIVATGATARAYPVQYMMLESAMTALRTDPAFNNGDYDQEPEKGLYALRTVMVPWVHAQEYWRQELWRSEGTTSQSFTEAYKQARSNLLSKADANDIILQMRTWQEHDVGTTAGFGGDTSKALRSIKVPVLYMPSSSDLYFTEASVRAEVPFIARVEFHPIPSLLGHPGALAGRGSESTFLTKSIHKFLDSLPSK